MKTSHLHFNTSIGVQKPESIRNKQQACPFCAREELTNLIEVDGPIILLKNKYPVLENAYQTVLIETDDCHGELSNYELPHLHRLLQFAIRNWLELDKTGKYESVILFKNHGPLSGGTIAHPHMQIIGLNNINYQDNIAEEVFQGITIEEKDEVRITLSTKPKVGFYEFNIDMDDSCYHETFGVNLQKVVDYILNNFPFKASSYNLFFYHYNRRIYVKIVPRFVTTPLYIGYEIPQVPDNLQWMADDIKSKYFTSGSS
ncbi:DUF4931 domain-containing protein [Bacillus sp. OK048]|uniref:DUF4931 domain-containing protein n=1 Tax=Bacillus sp. OK048 TaxID=1882761 RepID=UPI0008922F9B|nr:DUF4931 domain-containing protein [Bacillus sp. OK048]SDM74417.1 Galactose-1-phosphate uridylyltransferase [Bacillus sp. OK048]